MILTLLIFLAALNPAHTVTDAALSPEPFGEPPAVTVQIAATMGVDGLGLFCYYSAERVERRLIELDRVALNGYALGVCWQDATTILAATYGGVYRVRVEGGRLALCDSLWSGLVIGHDIRGGVHVQADRDSGLVVVEDE